VSSTIEADPSRVSTLAAPRRWLAGTRLPLLVGLAYYFGAQFAFLIGTLSDRVFALFWPPNVILFCALLFRPRREWPACIAAAFIAHVVAELGVGMPLAQLLVAFVTNCMVALLNAYAVRRLLDPPPWLGTFKRMGIYILITAGVSPAVVALGGAFVPILGGGSVQDYWLFWSLWYLANALPSVTLGPVLMIWLAGSPHWPGWKAFQVLEPAVIAIVLVVICVLSAELAGRFAPHIFLPAILLLPLPLILFASIRYGERGASGTILVIATTMTWFTLRGRGMFAGQDQEMSVLALQLFLTGLSIPILLLGAMVEELQNAGQTTRALAASLMRAQDEERRRIARDLHDSTGQNLIAASLIAGRLRDSLSARAMPLLDELEKSLKQSNRELRTVSYLLHPPYLDEAGLGLALRYFLEGFEERSGIQADLKISENIGRLAKDTELVIFRVVQEALTNVARHSGSSTALIRLTRESEEGGRLLLTVEDFGKGMKERTLGPGPASSGLGLISMRERLAQTGGRLQIESTQGHTLLQAVIPL
jgi:signal transduction histidine kinase